MAEHQTTHRDRTEPNLDALLVHEVKNALLMKTESAGIDVQVSAGEGTVRLHGVVDVLSHRTVAEEIAKTVPGVKRVINDITVADEEHRSDKHIMEDLNEKLARTPFGRGLGCRVHRGVVTLAGKADRQTDLAEAIRFVEGFPGVREVKHQRIRLGEGRSDDESDVSVAAERLLDELGYDHRLFQVYCAEGTLYIKGFVPTRADRTRIKTAMHGIPGAFRLEATLITEDRLEDEVH